MLLSQHLALTEEMYPFMRTIYTFSSREGIINIFVKTRTVQEQWTIELPKKDVIYHDPKVQVAEKGGPDPSLQTHDEGSSLFILY